MNSPNPNNMPPQSSASTNMESRIGRAIEQKPDVQIPTNFAAKVVASAVAQPLRRRRYKLQFGPMIALLSAPLAALALFALAPHTAPNIKSITFDAEVVFLAELAFIGWWISRTFTPKMNR